MRCFWILIALLAAVLPASALSAQTYTGTYSDTYTTTVPSTQTGTTTCTVPNPTTLTCTLAPPGIAPTTQSAQIWFQGQDGGAGYAPVVDSLACNINLPIANGVNAAPSCQFTAKCNLVACAGANTVTSWAITAQSTANTFGITSAGVLQGGSAGGSATTGVYTVTVAATNSTGTSPGVTQTVNVFATPTAQVNTCTVTPPVTNGVNVSPTCTYTALCNGGACTGGSVVTGWAITAQSLPNAFSITAGGILAGGPAAASVGGVNSYTVTVAAANAHGVGTAVTQTVNVIGVPTVQVNNCTINPPVTNSVAVSPTCTYTALCGGACSGASAVTNWAITAQSLANAFSISSAGVLAGGAAAASVGGGTSYTVTVDATNAAGVSAPVTQTVITTGGGPVPVVAPNNCTVASGFTNGQTVNQINAGGPCGFTATCSGVPCAGGNAITSWAISSQSLVNAYSISAAGVLLGGANSASVTTGSNTVTIVARNANGPSTGVVQTITAVPPPVVASLTCNVTLPVTNGVNVSPPCQYTATCAGVACSGASAITSWALSTQSTGNAFSLTSAGALQGGSTAASVVAGAYTVTVTATNAASTSPGVTQTVNTSGPLGFTTVAATSPSCQGIASCAPAGSRIVYVSNSAGNDGNPCTLGAPCKTVQKGWASLRSGSPDQLLFNCNDTWTLGASDGINVDPTTSTVKNGISPTGSIGGTITGPILVSYYDPAGGTCSGRRPLIQTNSASNGGTGLFLNMNHCHSGTCPTLNNIAIIGVELYAYQRDPSSVNFVAAESAHAYDGLDIIGGGTSTWVLLEDNKISYYNDGFSVDATGNGSGLCPAGTSVTLCNGSLNYRRNIIQHSYGYSNGGGIVTGTAQCIYTDHAVSALLDSNYLAYCGWDNTLGAPQTVTIASSVITWPKANYAFNALPFINGATMVFQNTSGGVTAGTQYYIINANSAAGTFQVATSYPSSTPVTISNGSNVMENVDVSQNVRNHNLYGAYAIGNGFTLTNNIAAWGRDVMDRPGGGTAGTTGLGVVSGNFLTFENIGISYGTFSGCCSGGGNEGPFTVLNMTGNVISQAGYQMFPGTFTDPGNNGAWGGDIEVANGTGACSGGTINFSNNLYSKMGTAGGSNSSTALRISDHVSGTVNNICVQNMIIYSSTVGISPNGGTGNVLTPQTCVDLTGANTGCADEPFPTPTRDILTYDHDTFGTTCTPNTGWNTTLNNTCWLDMHSREVARGLQNWPSNLAAPAIVSYMMAGYGITCPSAKWC